MKQSYLFCDNRTNLIADEDLFNNETNTGYTSDHNNTLIKNKKLRSNYQPFDNDSYWSIIIIVFLIG